MVRTWFMLQVCGRGFVYVTRGLCLRVWFLLFVVCMLLLAFSDDLYVWCFLYVVHVWYLRV